MGKLIEKEGRYFKECNVVMLPTKDKTSVIINNHLATKSNMEYRPDLINDKMIRSALTFQHLYITSDDEIKENSWCIIWTLAATSYLVQYKNGKYFHPTYNGGGYNTEEEIEGRVKKIIATTDKSLFVESDYLIGGKGFKIENTINLPQPSQSFIKKYCEQGGIDKVLVEYEPCYIDGYWEGYDILKTDSHNTITIKPVKERMYSREEVIKLLNAYGNDVAMEFSDCDCSGTEDFTFTEKEWIKENL